MAGINLCNSDPLLDTLRDIFAANPVKMPDARLIPLTVIGVRRNAATYRGKLTELLRVAPKRLKDFEPIVGEMPTVANTSSSAINIRLGLKILDGLLSGLGISVASIKGCLGSADKIKFKFSNVERHYADINWLGRALSGLSIDHANPAASIFFESNPFQCCIIDSTIMSNGFSVELLDKNSQTVGVTLPSSIGASVTGGIQASRQGGITFRGKKLLCFAFSCVEVGLDDHGAISALPPGRRDLVLDKRLLPHPGEEGGAPEHVLLSRTPSLLEIE